MTEEAKPVVKRGRLMIPNKNYIEKAREEFCRRLGVSEEFHIDPAKLPTSRLASSELTASKSPGSNFQILGVKEDVRENIWKKFSTAFDMAYKTLSKYSICTLLCRFSLSILESMDTLGHDPQTEAEIRFVYGDPLLKLMQNFTDNCNSSLEASVHRFSGGDERRRFISAKAHDAVTPRSRMDYAVYKVSSETGGVLALIMEAKMINKDFEDEKGWEEKLNNAVAQVIGYFVATTSDDDNPAVLCVLAPAGKIDLVILPYHHKDFQSEFVVDGLRIPFEPMTPDDKFHPSVMCLMSLMPAK